MANGLTRENTFRVTSFLDVSICISCVKYDQPSITLSVTIISLEPAKIMQVSTHLLVKLINWNYFMRKLPCIDHTFRLNPSAFRTARVGGFHFSWVYKDKSFTYTSVEV